MDSEDSLKMVETDSEDPWEKLLTLQRSSPTKQTSFWQKDESPSWGIEGRGAFSRDRGNDRVRGNDRDRGNDRGRGRGIDRGNDRSRGRGNDRGRGRSMDRGRDKGTDRGRGRGRGRDRGRGQGRGRGPGYNSSTRCYESERPRRFNGSYSEDELSEKRTFDHTPPRSSREELDEYRTNCDERGRYPRTFTSHGFHPRSRKDSWRTGDRDRDFRHEEVRSWGSDGSPKARGRHSLEKAWMKPLSNSDFQGLPHPRPMKTDDSLKEVATTSFKDEDEEVHFANKLPALSSKDSREVECTKETVAVSPESSNSQGYRRGNMSSKSGSKSDPKICVSPCYFKLVKDRKIICRTQCMSPPFPLSPCWAIDIVKRKLLQRLHDLPQFFLYPSPEDSYQKLEWNKFLSFLYQHDKVAVVKFEGLKMYISPSAPADKSEIADVLCFPRAVASYDRADAYDSKQYIVKEVCDTSVDQGHAVVASAPADKSETADVLCFPRAVASYNRADAYDSKQFIAKEVCDTSVDQGHAIVARTVGSLPVTGSMLTTSTKPNPHSSLLTLDPCLKGVNTFELDACVRGSNSDEKGTCSSISKCHEAVNSVIPIAAKEDVSSERNFIRADPSYLKTLGQAHSGWIFGAIAELVDNSRDAKASRLEIVVETIYDKTSGSEIPMLSIVDDGQGMDHEEILRMVSFGHKQPDEDNVDRIGRFGVGFKTGSMRLGRDALVLTQTTQSRSIAFLSQSLNEGKDNLEIPIVSYRRQGQCMEFDTKVQSGALAKYNLESIKKFSPFNEYLIGEKAGLFQCNTGTQIYIWNLDWWGSDYSLEWLAGLRGGSSFHQGDILIRSRRVRSRPGQTSRKVPLDYSLRSYLEVMFKVPRMKIYVQGSLVKSHPLAKSLNNTAEINEEIMGKPVNLVLGRSQVEMDEGNSGVFLYWHGRLIEAYKRVGGMIHSADMGRGVIGVIDVTPLMDDGNGNVWVHSNKQGFQDCEVYACLEEWLGRKADEYWDKFYDIIQLNKGSRRRIKPDNDWVQCDKCRKWRMLNADFDSRNLPKDWFCYMEPFRGTCETPEQKPERGVITIGTKRDYSFGVACDDTADIQIDKRSASAEGESEDDSNKTAEDYMQLPVLKKRRTRVCSKKQLSGS